MHQPTILVVDDDPTNIEALSSALLEHYEVRFAMSGTEAIAMARMMPRPDLVLLDVMLPDIDGYEVCRLLKTDRLTASVPIIFVTALSDPVQEERGLASGAVDYITKPFSPAIVRARIRNHIEMRRAYELLQRLAVTDPLTGLANRRHFDEALLQEVSRHRRHGMPLSLVLMDIDEFKHYNDLYGHPAGDDCLRLVALTLATALRRPADLVARVGGEEFACLLPETDGKGAAILAERIRKLIIDLAIPHQQSNVAVHVTASFGVSMLDHQHQDAEQTLYQQADVKLYQAKAQGRNRVIGP